MGAVKLTNGWVRVDLTPDEADNILIASRHVKNPAPYRDQDEDPDYPKPGWRHEVGNDDTSLGYRDWVERQRRLRSVDFSIFRSLVTDN